MRFVRTVFVRVGVLLSLVTLVSLVVSGTALAQSGTATLFGSIKDQQNAGVPGATLILTQTATSATRTVVTDDGGNYRFNALSPGMYSLKVELNGFRTALRDKIDLPVDMSTQLDIPLEMGSLAETVQVTAEAKVLNTSDASLGNVITGRQVRELPLEARNVVGLLSLQTGVVYIPKADAATTMDPRYGAVSGARSDQANVTLDGVDVNDAQNQNAFTSALRVTLDSVQEFRVSTSNYNAEYGIAAGSWASTAPAWIRRGDSAATRSRRLVKSSYSRSFARSSARRTLSSYSLSSGVIYRSAFLTVCFRMKSDGTFAPCAWVISM